MRSGVRSIKAQQTWLFLAKSSILLGGVLAVFLLSASAVQAEYRLNSGDVVEVSVFGVADFKRRVTVNVDGDLSLPLLGEVRVAGLTIAELREKVKSALVENNIIRNPDVTADLVEHRPFFINGDVAKPGSHPFQPGLTVRHAVAIAGGYDVLRFKVDNPLVVSADLRSQYEGLWTEFIKREARVTSLQAELEEKETVDLSKLNEAPIAARIIKELIRLELDYFNSRKVDRQKEMDYLSSALKHVESQVTSLAQRREQDEIGTKLQTEALERTSTLSAKGMAPISRLSEVQAAVALQKTRELETAGRLADAQRMAEEYGRRLSKTDDERRMKLVRDLQDAIVDRERARTQLQGIGEKLLYFGAINAQLARGGRHAPDVVIFRKIDGKQTRIEGDESTEVQPGDVIDVLFSQKQLVMAEPR